MKRLLFFVTDHQRRDLAIRLDRGRYFEVFYVTLKVLDRLDLLTDHPWIRSERIVDLPSLYAKYAQVSHRLTIDQVSAEVRQRELRDGIRSLHLLASYNYGRSMKPSDGYEAIVRRIWAEHRIAEELLDEARPDGCLGELTRSYMVIVRDLAWKRGIPYICPLEFPRSYFGSHLMIQVDTAGRSQKLENLYRKYKKGSCAPSENAVKFAESVHRNILDREKFTSNYIRSNWTFLVQKVQYRIGHLENWRNAYSIDIKYYPELFVHRNPIVATMNNFVLKPLRFRLADTLTRGMLQDMPRREKYIYFPLHYYPELVSSVWAHDFIYYHHHELHLIQSISKQLPTGYRLYVKEHMPMLGLRSENFYHHLQHLYNVRLFHPSANNFELIENAELVMTIANTTGMEAFILGKRVLTFHGSYYRHFEPIRIVDRNRPLHEQIVDALTSRGPAREDVYPAAAALYDAACKFELSPRRIDSWDFIFADESLPSVAAFFAQIIDGELRAANE